VTQCYSSVLSGKLDDAPAAVEAIAGSDVGCQDQDDCMHVKMLSLSN